MANGDYTVSTNLSKLGNGQISNNFFKSQEGFKITPEQQTKYEDKIKDLGVSSRKQSPMDSGRI